MNLNSTIFKQIAENNWEPIVFANLEGTVIYANPAAYSLYGYDREELIGEHVDIFNAQVSHDTGHIVQSIIDFGGWSGEIVQRKKNNETFTALLTVSLIFDENGEAVGYASNSKDISESVKQKIILQNALKDKEILFQEIHHRLKNNLAIISSILELQAAKSKDLEFIKSIRDSQGRIKATALAHEILYEKETLEKVDLEKYFIALCESVLSSFTEKSNNISFQAIIGIKELDVDHAIPLGLITNELLTNSIKHAFPARASGSILLKIERNGDEVSMQFRDNGVGLPNGFDARNESSTGMIVITSLLDQLEGEFSFENADGALIRLSFKTE